MKYSRKPWREFLRVPSRSRVRNWLLANSSPRSLKTGKWSRIFPLNRANCSLILQLAVISHDALRLYSRIIMRHVLEEADNLMHRNYHPSHNLISNGWKYSSLLTFQNKEYRFNSYIKIKKPRINQRRLYKFHASQLSAMDGNILLFSYSRTKNIVYVSILISKD